MSKNLNGILFEFEEELYKYLGKRSTPSNSYPPALSKILDDLARRLKYLNIPFEQGEEIINAAKNINKFFNIFEFCADTARLEYANEVKKLNEMIIGIRIPDLGVDEVSVSFEEITSYDLVKEWEERKIFLEGKIDGIMELRKLYAKEIKYTSKSQIKEWVKKIKNNEKIYDDKEYE